MTSPRFPVPPIISLNPPVRLQRPPKLWNGEKASTVRGTLTSLARRIPRFTRRPLLIPPTPPATAHPNPLYDAVIREAVGNRPEVAVGVVSPRYQLIQHLDVVNQVRAACDAMGWAPDRLLATLTLSEYGTRLHLVVHLPRALAFDPGDAHPVGLQLVALNAVDGSLALRIWLGYYRFVCANGLVVGSTLNRLRWRHIDRNPLPDVREVLREGLGIVKRDRATFAQWRKRGLERESLRAWVDGPLAASWGVTAAARTWHIAEHGWDAELADPFASGRPTEKPMLATVPVPGNPATAATVWDIAQALSWVARHLGDPEAAAQREADVPRQVDDLVRALRRRRARSRRDAAAAARSTLESPDANGLHPTTTPLTAAPTSPPVPPTGAGRWNSAADAELARERLRKHLEEIR